MKPLLFWVDEKWRRTYAHAPLMFPFWGTVVSNNTPFQKKLLAEHQFDTTLYGLAPSIEEADVVFLPYRYNVVVTREKGLIEEAHAQATRAGKVLLIDGTGDLEVPIDVPRSIVLRVGGYRFLRTPYEIHLPFFTDDLLKDFCGGALSMRHKQSMPRVGFSGWATLPPTQMLKAIVKELPERLRAHVDARYGACKKGIFFRQQALRALATSQLVDANVVRRATYSAHTATASKDPGKLREEFVHNLLDSDYGLDVRGDANNSMRLYEILSLGRIPVMIDTERNFPFEDEIDYSAFSLRVDFQDIETLPQRISDFHASLSDTDFVEMQRRARDAYVRSFQMESATPYLVSRIRRMIASV